MTKIIIVLASLVFQACSPTISGYVTNHRNEVIGVSDARVNLTHIKTSQSFVIIVDENGYFSSDVGLPPGPYLLEALVPGYGIQSTKVQLIESVLIKVKINPLIPPVKTTISVRIDEEAARGSGSVTLMPPKL
jgi:hypothetical protein